jgi:hypothetical protein
MQNASLSFVMPVSLSLSLSLSVRQSVCPSVNTQGISCNVKIVCVCTIYYIGKRYLNTATAQRSMSSPTLAETKLRTYIVFIVLYSLLLLLLLLIIFMLIVLT